MKFKSSSNIALQIVSIATVVLSQLQESSNPEVAVWAVCSLSILQGVSAVLAHYTNPDGESASRPFDFGSRRSTD